METQKYKEFRETKCKNSSHCLLKKNTPFLSMLDKSVFSHDLCFCKCNIVGGVSEIGILTIREIAHIGAQWSVLLYSKTELFLKYTHFNCINDMNKRYAQNFMKT